MPNPPYAVELSGVSMSFMLNPDKVNSIKEYVIRLIQHRLSYETFQAVSNISFRIAQGDSCGLVGLNGAGKSTVLRLIAGVMKPSQGQVVVKGTVAPLIELGAGFDDELTTKENIFLNAAVLGHSPKFVKGCYDDIIAFSELKDFEDAPLKSYSSGMRVRLAFAVATLVKPDILIADEVLAVGDHKFQKKCLQRIGQLRAQGTTILLVSHSIDHIRENCNKAIWLEKGSLIMDGDAQKVCDAYQAQD